ncbi:MAG TPA: PDZ domain-containing protein, partial [Kofleriaceae bacterium]|nr:PDZ domain-containing protein [Kofleriaceae bacterium]
MWISAAAVIAYAVAVLIAAVLSPDLGFFTYQGTSVLGVEAGSVAAGADLQAGDVIVEVNGQAVETAYGLATALDRIEPG